MLDASQFDLNDVLEGYVFANTSAFLGKRLRESMLVQRLGTLYEPELVARTVTEIAAKAPEERAIEEVTLAYACLGALYVKDYIQAKTLLHDVDLTSLKWAAELAAYFEPPQPLSSATFVNVRFEPTVNDHSRLIVSAATGLTFRASQPPLVPVEPSFKESSAGTAYFKFKTAP
ncbi:hypothetical protein [Burkholderia multivorans]|uniref:hypothetical protein n=1 Tax=Burkholderia multivorans TaxID=87883 RepID=UPI000AE7A61D|nr:hypothetical protein [Burkholderia multivorans]MBU9252473.1 hypothetical protein [Burkholderia multivorans]MBU9257615.1 hypothetical protein [Burkholderia multivorans]MDN7760098.1 hypothetical protein [Burkholderia multivorans]MDN8100285.1 hypothetical protein [Burkholderia multivorans]